jgi:thiamine-monophosphate kinase
MGEFELIEKLRERFGLEIGDDAAITAPAGATATSVDAFVDGLHFRREWTPPRAIGHKALAASLSDLAAMAAEPGEAYVVLGVPEDLDENECLEIYEGIAALAMQTQTRLAGGDVTRAPVLTLAITVVGHAPQATDFITRSGAKPGDVLMVTGELGGAAAGLALLERPELADRLGEDVAERLRARQLTPTAQIAAGRALAAAGATAMIDVSDGLAADAGHLARCSGVAIEIDVAKVPIQEGSDQALALAGGEDYELLVTLPSGSQGAAAAVAELGGTLTEIGAVGEAASEASGARPPKAGEGLTLRGPEGEIPVPPGFDHLR